jgi:sigma-B regulation protein RsbU (phosphoserine phosphatase)
VAHAGEFHIRRQDGSASYLEASASRWLNESLPAVSAIFRDVSVRRQAQDTMVQLHALGQSQLETERGTAELREQFIAVLGHDLRNPLASVSGASRLLRREIQSEKALKILGMMDDSVDRMAGLIDNVLDFARGRLGGGITLERKVAPLDRVINQVIAELTADRPDRTLDVVFSLAEPVSFDAVRIGQLVSNLLGNAFTHGDPKQAVTLTAVTADGILNLEISNRGRSIPKAALSRLFQPFFRGEVQPSQQGLGLGLHIASEIAKAHGGSLGVNSTPQVTTFILQMPVFGADRSEAGG